MKRKKDVLIQKIKGKEVLKPKRQPSQNMLSMADNRLFEIANMAEIYVVKLDPSLTGGVISWKSI